MEILKSSKSAHIQHGPQNDKTFAENMSSIGLMVQPLQGFSVCFVLFSLKPPKEDNKTP